MISIIVPIFNVEKELPRCIESIINQTYDDLEIVLVNDGSTDESQKICEEYADRDNRIRLINKANGGLSDARNYGIEHSIGEYLMLVDADDYIEKDACEKLIEGFCNDSIDFVVGALREIRSGGTKYQKRTGIIAGRIYNARDFIIESINKNEWYAPAVLNLYKRKFIDKNGLRFAKGRFFEDLEMLPRLYLNANKICYIDYYFYNYIKRDNSITTSVNTPQKTEDAIQNYIEWKRLFDSVEDVELRDCLYGYLLKCYLKSCRSFRVTKWVIPGVSYEFAKKYSLNYKEKCKAFIFNHFPRIYVSI